MRKGWFSAIWDKIKAHFSVYIGLYLITIIDIDIDKALMSSINRNPTGTFYVNLN